MEGGSGRASTSCFRASLDRGSPGEHDVPGGEGAVWGVVSTEPEPPHHVIAPGETLEENSSNRVIFTTEWPSVIVICLLFLGLGKLSEKFHEMTWVFSKAFSACMCSGGGWAFGPLGFTVRTRLRAVLKGQKEQTCLRNCISM